MNDSEFGVLMTVLFFLLVAWLHDLDEWWGDKNTIYSYSCVLDKKDTDKCFEDKPYYATTTYKVSFDTQIIIYKTTRNNAYTYKEAGVCNVFDRNNWSCTDGKYLSIMDDGVYSEKNAYFPSIKYAYMPKWKFLFTGGWAALKTTFD